jgi:hypothetical protein
MKFFIVFVIFGFFSQAESLAQSVSIVVHYGDRVTRFEIAADVKGPILTVRSNDLGVTSVKMTTRNYDYVIRRLREIAKMPNKGRGCERSRVDAFYPEEQATKTLQVCLDVKGEQRDSMSTLLDLLSASI